MSQGPTSTGTADATTEAQKQKSQVSSEVWKKRYKTYGSHEGLLCAWQCKVGGSYFLERAPGPWAGVQCLLTLHLFYLGGKFLHHMVLHSKASGDTDHRFTGAGSAKSVWCQKVIHELDSDQIYLTGSIKKYLSM